MTVAWPHAKKAALFETLKQIMARKNLLYVTPKEMAHILGIV